MKKNQKVDKDVDKAAEEAQKARLSKVQSDQTFHEMPKREKKVKVDSRFKAMFYDKKFASTTANVDRHGRVVNKLKEREDLHNLYELEESENSEHEVEEPVAKKKEKRPDFARGEANMSSSSSDEEESEAESESDNEGEEEDNDELNIHKKWGELDNNARRVEWTSNRLAVCNLDWDKMTAEDIFVALESFKPADGKIKSICVYLSDFGAEQLKKEEEHGPQLPVPKKTSRDDSDSEEEDSEKAKPEVVRAYQFERYRFYYAVVECDSDETANAIYEACDGIQYQNSGLTFDLRFIPDETTFEDSHLRDQCLPDSVNLRKYKPNNFMSAVTHSNAKLDWEIGDYNRRKKVQKAFEEDADMDDLNELVASGSEDESNDNAAKILLSAASVNVYSKKGHHFEDDEKTEEKSEEVPKPAKSKSKFKAKLVEKKKRKLAETAARLPVNLDDSRFSALYTSSDFAIDKTDSHYRGGALVDHQVKEKIRRKN